MADVGEEGHTCKECGKSYNKNWRLEEHIRSHTGERPYKCTFEGCGKSYIRAFHLKRHSVVHTGKQPTFKCSYPGCTTTFSEKHGLKRHEKRSHNLPFKCGYEGCNKSFKKSSQLRRHTCLHTNESLFKCQVEGCSRGFDTSTRLRRHMKTHNKGYLCSVAGCSEGFDKFSKLAVHIRSHGFVCEHCNKTFSKIWLLKEHARIHSSDRDMYECPREGCSRMYTKLKNLKVHIKAFHDGDRPYLCTVEWCGKRFAHKVSLRQHMVLHSQNKIKPRPPAGEKSTQKKKSKKKRKPVSLAKQLSGYRSSPSESSDNHAMETRLAKRKAPNQPQRKTSVTARVNAASVGNVQDPAAPHSDSYSSTLSRDMESTNSMPSINAINTVVMDRSNSLSDALSSNQGSVTQAINMDMSEELQVNSLVSSTSSVPANDISVESTASMNRSQAVQDGITSGLFSNLTSSSNGSAVDTANVIEPEGMQDGLSSSPLSNVPVNNVAATNVANKSSSEGMNVDTASASSPSAMSSGIAAPIAMSSAITANIDTAFSTSVSAAQNEEAVVDDLMFSSSDEEVQDMDWEPAEGNSPVGVDTNSENEFERPGNDVSTSQGLLTNDVFLNDNRLTVIRTNSPRKAVNEEMSSGMVATVDPKESSEVSDSCQHSNYVPSLPEASSLADKAESNGKRSRNIKKKGNKGMKKPRGPNVDTSSRVIKRGLVVQNDSLVTCLNTFGNSGSGNEEVNTFESTDFPGMDDVLQVIIEGEDEDEGEGQGQCETSFENEDINLDEEYARVDAFSPAHSSCSEERFCGKHSTSSANHTITCETHVPGNEKHVTSCSERRMASSRKHVTSSEEHVISSEEHVIIPENHVLRSPVKEATIEESRGERSACNILDNNDEIGSFVVQDVIEDGNFVDVANDYGDITGDEEGMDVSEQQKPARDNTTPVRQIARDNENGKVGCSDGPTCDTNKEGNLTRDKSQVARDINSHNAVTSPDSTCVEGSHPSERTTENRDSEDLASNNTELKRTRPRCTNKRSSQRNARNVGAKASLNKRALRMPVPNVAKAQGKSPNRACGVDGSNSELNDFGSESKGSSQTNTKPEKKKNIELAEHDADVSKAKFRNRGNILTCDLQTLELLWNFKGT